MSVERLATDGRRPRVSTWLAATCWMPLASLVATEIYVSGFEGWGAWAAGPMFLIPLFLALLVAAAGSLQLFVEMRSGAIRASTVLFTCVAGMPILWLLVRRYVV